MRDINRILDAVLNTAADATVLDAGEAEVLRAAVATDETYQSSANRETWAFNLQWQNDQGFYNLVLDDAETFLLGNPDLESEVVAYRVGEHVIERWQTFARERLEERAFLLQPERDLWDGFLRDVGSFWRVDKTEVGEAVLEGLVNEGRVVDTEAEEEEVPTATCVHCGAEIYQADGLWLHNAEGFMSHLARPEPEQEG